MLELHDFFKKEKYVGLSTPRTGVKPLRLLLKREKYFELLGYSLKELFEPDAHPYPAVLEEGAKLPKFKGTIDSKKADTASIGVQNYLKKLFSKYSVAKDFSLKYKIVNPSIQSVVTPDLERFISGAIAKLGGLSMTKESMEKSEIYIITEVVKCSKFHFSTDKENSLKLNSEISVDQVKLLESETEEFDETDEVLEYKEKEPIAIGIKAVQLFFNKKPWWHFWKDEKEEGFSIKKFSDKEFNLSVRGDSFDHLKEDVLFKEED